MVNVTPQYITDDTGKKLSVIIPIADFESIMEELDELEDIRLYDEAKAANEPSMPAADAFRMIEANRKNNNK